jgi:hypothetical protein
MLEALIGLAKYGSKFQIHRLGESQYPVARCARQALDQAIDYLHRGNG